MKTPFDATQRQTAFGASFLAFVLSLAGSAAHANANRTADRLNAFSARETLRAERREARMERQEMRVQQNLIEPPTAKSHQQIVDNVSNVHFARQNGARHNNADRFNRAASDENRGSRRDARSAQLPGQVSTFRTSRPNLGRSTFETDRGNSKLINRGIALDFSSTKADITVGDNVLDGTITLVVGGEEKQFSAGSKVTAAEFAALTEKLATGTQSLTLNNGGAAEGGSLNLNLVSDNGLTIRASELVVPQNVTVEGDFGRTAEGVRVTKDLVNYGSIIASSTNSNKNTAVIGARDIENAHGGSIVSVSSASNPKLNLALRADRDLSNAGAIESAGDLELTAGRSLTNSSGGVIGAAGNVLLNSSLINNQGSVSAQGDITLAGAADNTLGVNNFGGTMTALNGSIDLRESGFNGIGNSIIYGGDLLSMQLNINAGQATGDVIANKVSGVINSSGLAAHVSADTDTLVLGTQCLTGDPTYYNTGNIIIGGNITVAEDLTIIAGGNITDISGTPFTLTARNGSNIGQDITLIAGANITTGTGELPPAGGPATLLSGAQQALSAVTVSGESLTGGNIIFTNANQLDARGTAGNASGGNITLVAYDNFSLLGGTISVPSTNLLASGNGSGNNGNVAVIGPTTISLGQILTSAGSGTLTGTGTVLLAAYQPTTSNGSPIVFGTNGSITSGNSFVPDLIINSFGTTMSVGNISAANDVTIFGVDNTNLSSATSVNGNIDVRTTFGRVNLSSSATYQANDILVDSADLADIQGNIVGNDLVQIKTGNSINLQNLTINAASVAILSTYELAFDNATINATKGILALSGQQINGFGPGVLNGSKAGNAANITVLSGVSWTDNGADVTVNGSSGLGGFIFGALTSITADSTGGGAGGNITIVAMAAPSNSVTGNIQPNSVPISAKGAGGLNGNVTIVANGTGYISGNAIELDSVDVTGGTGGGSIILSATTANTAGAGPISKLDATYAGSFAGTTPGAGNIRVFNSLQAQQSVTVNAGTNGVNISSINVNGLTGNQAGGTIAVTGGGVTFAGTVQANGIGSGSGGTVSILADNLNAGLVSANGGSTGFGGAVTVVGNSLSFTSLSANGGTSGAGNSGGAVEVSANTVSSYSVGSLSASGGGTNGDAGLITVRNNGSGGITLNPSNISLSTNATAGTLVLDATPGATDGPIVISGSTLSLNGNPGYDNGQIRLSGSSISRTGTLLISATGGQDQTGLIELTTTSGNIAVSGDFSVISGGATNIYMTGSTAISTSGTGGDVVLQSRSGLNAPGVDIIASSGSPAIASGDITVTGFLGNYTVGDLTSVGTGTFGGGTVTLNNPNGTFSVGVINVDGGTSGAGGTVTLNSAGASNSLSSIFARGFGSATGGTITLTSSSGSDIHFQPNASLVVDAAASAGSIQISTNTGAVVFSSGSSTLSAKGGTANGAISFSQLGALSMGFSNLTLDTNGAGSDSDITVDFNSGGITSADGNLTIAASGNLIFPGFAFVDTDGGDISITASSTSHNGLPLSLPNLDASTGAGVPGDVSVTVGSSVTLGIVSGNDINISTPALTELTFTSITAVGTTAISTGRIAGPGTGTISSDALQLTLSTAAVMSTFNTDVNTLTVAGANNSISVTEADGLSLLGITNVFNVNLSASGNVSVDAGQTAINDYTIATSGLVTISAPVSVANSIALTSTGNNVQINSGLTVSGASGSIALQTTDGGLIQEGAAGSIATGSGGSLNIILSGATPGTAVLTDGTNNIFNLNGSGGGSISVNNGANALSILNLGSTQSLVSTTSNNVTGISLGGTINTSGTVTLNTPRFTAGANDLTAASITVQSTTDLTLDSNGALLAANTPAAGSPGSPSSPTAINFVTGAGEDLTLIGTMTMTGDVTFNNVGGTTTSQNNSLYAGTNNVVLKTANWIQQGNGNITGNILFVGGVSIVNPDGDLVLSSNLTFIGQDLVLAARNNVVLGNFNINLSNTTDSGNDLIIIAGYTLTPTGGGQQQTTLPFTVGAPTTGGGSVAGTGIITTSSTSVGGNGGNVTVVTTGAGTISLGNIDTSSTGGVGGDVMLIGAGVTVNNITTSGSPLAGDVSIRGFGSQVELDNSPNPMVIQNGKITGGTFVPAVTAPGPIVVTNVTAESGSVSLVNQGSTVTVNNLISANSVEIKSDALTFTTANAFSVNPDAIGNGGTIDWMVGTLTTPGTAPFALNADGSGTGSGGNISVFTFGLTPVFVGTPAKPPKGAANILTLSAVSGALGGNGGSLILFTSGNLSVDTDFLTAAPQSGTGNWSGASYQLASANLSGKTTLQVTGDIDAEGVGSGNGGFIFLQSRNKKTFTVNSSKAPKNGNFGELNVGTTGGIVVINTGGGVNVASDFSNAPSVLTLGAGMKGSVTTGKGVSLVTGGTLNLSSETGAIGKKPLTVSAPTLIVQSQGIVNLNSTLNGQVTTSLPLTAGKAFNLTAVGDVLLASSMDVLGDVNISTTGAIRVDNTITTQSGSIALTAGSGTLDVNQNITANNGGIVLANLDTTSGAVDIDSVVIKTDGKGDDVIIAIGAPPKKGTNTTAETGFVVDPQGTKGLAFFGPAGGVVTPGTVTVNVINKNVIFNNLSTGGQLITVANGAVITADPPSRTGAGLSTTPMNSVFLTTAMDFMSSSSQINAAGSMNSVGSLNSASLMNASSLNTNVSNLTSNLNLNGVDLTQMTLKLQPMWSSSQELIANISDLTSSDVIATNSSASSTDGFLRTDETVVWSSGVDRELLIDADFRSEAIVNDQEIGNVVFAPRSDMTVETRHGTVVLKAGSVALIMQSENSLAVYDLHDECKNAVTVRSGNTQMSLAPGRHATISSQPQAEFVDVNAIELVQYRGVNQNKLRNGFVVYTSEFSIPSACYAVKPLAQIMNSKHAESRKLAQRLIKTTSVILMLNPDRGDYVQFFKPRVAAMR